MHIAGVTLFPPRGAAAPQAQVELVSQREARVRRQFSRREFELERQDILLDRGAFVSLIPQGAVV